MTLTGPELLRRFACTSCRRVCACASMRDLGAPRPARAFGVMRRLLGVPAPPACLLPPTPRAPSQARSQAGMSPHPSRCRWRREHRPRRSSRTPGPGCRCRPWCSDPALSWMLGWLSPACRRLRFLLVPFVRQGTATVWEQPRSAANGAKARARGILHESRLH